MKRSLRNSTLVLLAVFSVPGCFRGGARFAADFAAAAIFTAAVVSATAPPPAQIVYAPPPRPGYAWQPGYWSLQDGQWIWIVGTWVAVPPGYQWSPAHWEQLSDGTWRFVHGQWITAQPPS